MMRNLLITCGLGLVVAMGVASCTNTAVARTLDIDTNIGEIKANDRQQTFSVSAFEKIKGEGNMVYSPLGIEVLYSILREGAKGDTYNQLDSVIGLTSEEAKNISRDIALNKTDEFETNLKMANLVVVRDTKSLYDNYTDTIEWKYGAEIWSEDLSSSTADKINQWVSEKTNGLIDKVADEFDESAVMCGYNALYFDADWTNKFDYSTPTVFSNLNGKKVKVDMMGMMEHYRYLKTKDFKVVALPYSSIDGKKAQMHDFAFYVFLPQKGKDFAPILDYLKTNNLTELRKQMDDYGKKDYAAERPWVDVRMPKFDVSSDINVVNVLNQLGVKACFDSHTADFSKISKEAIHVSQSSQKAIIKVDEEGTEAAAVTNCTVLAEEVLLAAKKKVKCANFYADHPFIYMIVCENTNTILFMGQYTDGKMNENEKWVTDENLKGAATLSNEDYKYVEVDVPEDSKYDDVPVDPDKVYPVVEEMPEFPGGYEGRKEYLAKNTRYPSKAKEKGIQDRVIVTFIVEKDGSLSDINVVKSVDKELDKEAVRVVSSMPKWTPGKHNGKTVRVKYTIPVTFRL